MSKANKQSTEKQSSMDDYTLIEKISRKYFAEIETSVPHYQQSLFDLQNEYYKAWRNAVSTNISLHKEFASKTGLDSILPPEAQTIIENINEELVRARSIRDKVVIVTIDAAKKNVMMWNQNANTFSDLNRNIMHYWMSAFAPRQER